MTKVKFKHSTRVVARRWSPSSKHLNNRARLHDRARPRAPQAANDRTIVSSHHSKAFSSSKEISILRSEDSDLAVRIPLTSTWNFDKQAFSCFEQPAGLKQAQTNVPRAWQAATGPTNFLFLGRHGLICKIQEAYSTTSTPYRACLQSPQSPSAHLTLASRHEEAFNNAVMSRLSALGILGMDTRVDQNGCTLAWKEMA